MINIGWIGCGRHARQMLLPYLSSNGMRVSAICDSNSEALQQTATEYGVSETYADYRGLLDSPNIEAVGMAVGPNLHYIASLEALKRGLPVFLEKPPAATAKEAQNLERVARDANKPVLVGFMKRYSVGNRIAKNVLGEGEFGNILGVTGTYMTAPTYFEGEVDYSGFYLHHCIHYMDLIPWFLGEDFGDLAVRSISPSPGRLLIHLNFQTSSGRIGQITMGTVQSRGTPMEEIRIMGDHARLHIDNIINVALFRNPPFKADDPNAILSPQSDTMTWTPNFTAAANEEFKGYKALLADVGSVFRGESRPGIPNIRDGAIAMERLEKMIALVSPR